MKNKEGEWCRCLVTVAAVGGRWPATMGGEEKPVGRREVDLSGNGTLGLWLWSVGFFEVKIHLLIR